jgi:hypothetical protein
MVSSPVQRFLFNNENLRMAARETWFNLIVFLPLFFVFFVPSW